MPVNNFSVMMGLSHRFLGINQQSRELMFLAQGTTPCPLWGSNLGLELSLIGHFTYRYISGKYCDISIQISIYNINIQVIFQQSVL